MAEQLLLKSGDLTIRKSPMGQTEPQGFYFGEKGFQGWDDGVTMRSYSSPRPQAHGEFDAQGFLSGRLMSLSGWAIASSPQQLERLREKFIGHGALGGRFIVAVTRNGLVQSALGRVATSSAPTFVDNGSGLRAEWSVSWWFPEPWKYGKALGTSGIGSSVTVTNRGNVDARPRLKVTGTRPSGYTITGHGGREIVVASPLTPSTPHEIRLDTGRLYVDGVRTLRGIDRGEAITFPPGRSIVTVSAGASIEVFGNDTYL